MKHSIEQAILALLMTAGLVAMATADADILVHDGPGYHGHGGGVALVITSSDRFDPLVQKLMVKQQMADHPIIDEPKFLVIPHNGDAELTEMQIRYLEKLLEKEQLSEE